MLKILSGLGFLLAVLFVATISGELVGLLDAIGTLSGLSPTLLGLTLFAFGNSVGEFVTNLSIARDGILDDGARGVLWRTHAE
ncbi:hypothetical protein BC831DRAFT_143595 [Entophlyctis helioformis]|nr:hypothetical protein BC831DRAFT_143595 [Entophlyctis helioformis]